MTDPDWQRVRQAFAAAVESGPQERRRILDRLRDEDPRVAREVEFLLDADSEAEGFLESPPPFSAELLSRRPGALAADDRIGPYRILREVARGGMGDVYLAERADGQYRQEVAIKILHAGLQGRDATVRFVAERQILASLEHPNIARLLDGGTTDDGRPYLVMEHIDGLPITEHCAGSGLRIDERVRLFVHVCRAVGYAHRNLVVHRDLKPSNILVTEGGDPKLLDFGIAKLLEESEPAAQALRTRTGLHLMTPSYASPEQVRGDPVATASDVYQLGLLLHEILAEARPYQLEARSPRDIERIVCESEPEPLPPDLPTDLRTVVAMALRKEPERRYASADLLADDLERFLAHRPVSARPATWRYRASRFVRRNRAPVSAAALVALLLVVLAGVSVRYAATTARQAREIAAERDRARAGEARAEQVTEFMVGLFESALPEAERRDTLTVRSVLDRAADRIDDQLLDEPAVRAALLNAVGRIQYSLGALDEGKALVERALALRRELHPEPHPDLVESLHYRAAHERLGFQFVRADSLYREAMAVHRQLPDGDRLREAELLEGRATTLRDLDRPDSALILIRESLALRQDLQPPGHPDHLEALGFLAYVLRAAGDLEEAERIYRQVLAGQRTLGEQGRQQLPWTLSSLAYVVAQDDRHDEAADLYGEAAAVHAELFGETHRRTLDYMGELSTVLARSGRLDEAEAVARDALRRAQSAYPDSTWQVGTQHVRLGSTLMKLGRYSAAAESQGTGMAFFATDLGADHLWTATAEHELGMALLLSRRLDEGRRHLDRSYEVLRTDLRRATTLLNPPNLETLVERLRTTGDSARAARYQEILDMSV